MFQSLQTQPFGRRAGARLVPIRQRLTRHGIAARLAAAARWAGVSVRRPSLRQVFLLFPLLLLSAPALVRAAASERVPVAARQGEPARVQGAVSIRVRPGGWGAADERDIARVLGFVAGVLAPAFPRHAGAIIDIAYRPEGPTTLLERMPDGAYRMYLSVQDTRWDQFTYQFAHEYCHVVTNAEQRARQDAAVLGTQWFEESMCEAVSLLALQRVAARWEQAPPVDIAPGYATAFSEYAQRLMSQAHRRLPVGAPADRPLENWYAANRVSLQLDPYLRPKNEVVAGALHAWLRDSEGALETIGFIGVDGLRNIGDGQVFPAYLERWRGNTPERLRDNVRWVQALFGLASPPAARVRVVER